MHHRETQQHSYNGQHVPFRSPLAPHRDSFVEPQSPATFWSERERGTSEALLDSNASKRKRTEYDANLCTSLATEELFRSEPVCTADEEDLVLIEESVSSVCEEVGNGHEFHNDRRVFGTKADLIREEPFLQQRDGNQYKEMQEREFNEQDAFGGLQEPLGHEPANQADPTPTNHHTLFMNQEFDRMATLVAHLQSENESLKLHLAFPDSVDDETANPHENPMTLLRTEARQIVQELVGAIAKIREGFDKGRAEVVQGMNAVANVEQRLEALGRMLSFD
ncbi:hypothetical protein HDU98_005118 [Podochytrium sp. JEL0797]|nr:hypothetical protein HDU98_005118 [Podochytrium sp. JEL0797]